MADDELHRTSVDSSFSRFGLGEAEEQECYELIEALHPGKRISPASCQGYCSITVLVGEDTVVQFRPTAYRLDIRIADAARHIFGILTPKTTYLTTLQSGLLVYQMSRVGGISLSAFRGTSAWTEGSKGYQVRSSLVRQFSALLSHSWHTGRSDTLPLGLVGRSIVSRLQILIMDLPLRFQWRAKHILRNIHQIEALPWVLTHGDIRASNIMVHSTTGQLTGLIDWAEAEGLPFGVCLYGVEEILGEITASGFKYYPDADALRKLFWTELVTGVSELKKSRVLDAVKLARDLGVLLWYGIAFDDGALDRVVQEGRDVEEIHRLDAFFSASGMVVDGCLGDLACSSTPISI